MTWRYRHSRDGKVIKEVVAQGNPLRGTPIAAQGTLDQRVRNALYHLECKEGSRFKITDYSKSSLQKVWADK